MQKIIVFKNEKLKMNNKNEIYLVFKYQKSFTYYFLVSLMLSIFFSCSSDPKLNQNNLKLETSAYLIQHAKNPIFWQSWDDNLYKNFNSEEKLLVVSIGYSSCHWCHVMAHESFEDKETAKKASEILINKGIKNIIITMGEKGAFYKSSSFEGLIPTKKVSVIDSTAAGDTFNGALVAGLSMKMDMLTSIDFANNAATYSVTKLGAQSSAPSINDLNNKFLKYVHS